MKPRALCLLISVVPAIAGCGQRVLFEAHRPECACTVAVLEDGSGQRVRWGNREEKPYLGIGAAAIAASPDGLRIAYPARTQDGWIVVIDGMESPVYDGIAEIVWSPDGRRIAYAAEQRGRWLVVRDGKVGPLHDALRTRSLRFSPDSTHLAYVAQQGDRVFTVADGGRSALYDGIGHLRFAADGHIAFAARRDSAVFVVKDGVESPAYEDIAEIAVSPGGRRIAWTARTAEGWRVIGHNGPAGERFERISPLVFSPGGQRLAYAAKRGNDEFVVNEGEISPPYEAVAPHSLVFGAEGATLAFVVRREGKWHVVAGGMEQGAFDEVERPVFVGSSTAVVYLARTGGSTVFVTGGRPFPAPAGAAGLVLSPDGRRYAYTAPGVGNRMAVLHGRIEGSASCQAGCRPSMSGQWVVEMLVEDSLVFSPDSTHVGFVAGDTGERTLFFFADGARIRRIATSELFTLGIETARPPEPSHPNIRDFVRNEMAGWLRQRSRAPRRKP